jgi:hypothetical protein
MRARALAVPLVLVMVAGCSTPAPTPESTAAPSLTPTPTLNGYELLTAKELLAKSRDALHEASSFRVKISASIGIITSITDVVYVGDVAKGTQFDGSLAEVGEVTKVGPTAIDGKPAITLKSSDGSTIHISTEENRTRFGSKAFRGRPTAKSAWSSSSASSARSWRPSRCRLERSSTFQRAEQLVHGAREHSSGLTTGRYLQATASRSSSRREPSE